ncbi:hypothetical protein J2T09_002527 [Neorhizobium huautlense]|uniref:Uncharacterized protein n=1 Tax=Neorhizobium huautlense TaxID=67774 RepID=A0ABT9PUB5_9HYPH|nr:hypothetical protein [Neorhizobium huautlense]MDP9837770.1 hypothetical protein [Neorhizobium huautlense]
MSRFSYSIVTGWYADHAQRDYKTYGDEFVRSARCFDLWYHCIQRFTDPKSILIIDSASPVLPELPADPRISQVRLQKNFGHAAQDIDFLCGWSRALILGLMYGYANGDEYTVLIEQGTLFHGQDIIEQQIAAHPDADIIAPNGNETPQPLQTGIMIFRTAIIPRFVANYQNITTSDKALSPEVKCAIAARGMRLAFSDLPFGRRRPLDWKPSHFFLRHGTQAEIGAFVQHLGWGEHLLGTDPLRDP